MRTAVLAFVVALLLGPGGRAREADAQPRRDPADAPAERGSGDSRDRREQIKKKIRALRAYTLTEELSLDEQTAARLFPVLARYDDDFDRLLEQRMEIHRLLNRVARSSNRDPHSIDRAIDDATANQRAFWDLQDKRLQTLRKILTAKQTAKLLIVLPTIERRIENQLRKAIQRRAGSAVDDDDDQEPDELAPPPPRQRRREGPLAPRGGRSNAPGNTAPCDPSAGPCR